MSIVFFPSCKTQEAYPAESRRLAAYVEKRLGVQPIGCCRVNYQTLTQEDTALYICNNCAAMIEESSQAGRLLSVWELIDADPDFPFPDWHGVAMTVQDCWTAVERRSMQEAVRSLLRKLNVTIVEQEENFDKTRFCNNVFKAPSERNAQLAPKRYLGWGAEVFHPTMTEEERLAAIKAHCDAMTTDKVLCSCKFCADAIRQGGGGKEAVYLLSLLFPED